MVESLSLSSLQLEWLSSRSRCCNRRALTLQGLLTVAQRKVLEDEVCVLTCLVQHGSLLLQALVASLQLFQPLLRQLQGSIRSIQL